ncbi:MAG: hypothetical protein Salg2KO_18120 [Salibacteraceae bacterium]
MKFSLWYISAALLLVGCTNPKVEKIAQLKSECIEIHDEVMPSWQDIASMSGEIKKQMASISDTIDSTERVNLIAKHQHAIQILDSAYDAMGDWMEEYEPSMEETQSIDSALSYYEAEKERISRVNELMKKSIDHGEKVLALEP